MTKSLLKTLNQSLGEMTLEDKDAAAVRLAKHYAESLDAGADAIKMGPAYLACLESLGMTPRARAAISGKVAPPSEAGRRPLDELRAKRAARTNGA